MKADFKDLTLLLLNEAFFCKEVNLDELRDSYHFHNGFEIALIKGGTGSQIIADYEKKYDGDDLTILGPYLPHRTINNGIYGYKNAGRALVFYFDLSWIPSKLFSLPDFRDVDEFILKAKRGIDILGYTKMELSKNLLRLRDANGLRKVSIFFDIIRMIIESKESACIVDDPDLKGFGGYYLQPSRIQEVVRFIKDNYAEQIGLNRLSEIACMTDSSFSRYFSLKTNRTPISFLNEVRINEAKKMLVKNNSIQSVCYSCGFNNLSSFYRNFKKYVGVTPKEFVNSIG